MISTVPFVIDEYTKKGNEAHKKCFVFNIITNQSVQKGASVLFMLIQLLLFFFFPTVLLPVMLLSACVFWMSLLIWDVVLLESCCGPKQIHAELAATIRQLKIWRDEVRPEASKKKKPESRTTRSHALLITHSLQAVFSICVHQAQKKNNMGLPAGWRPG